MGDVRVALRWDRLVGGSARSARVRRPLVAIVPPAVPRRRQFTHCACGARGRAPTKTPVGLRARARARHRQESAPLGGGERRLCRDAIWRERLTGAPVARRRTRLGEPRRRVRVSLRRVRARAAARRLRRCRCRRRCCEPGRPRRPPPRRDPPTAAARPHGYETFGSGALATKAPAPHTLRPAGGQSRARGIFAPLGSVSLPRGNGARACGHFRLIGLPSIGHTGGCT